MEDVFFGFDDVADIEKQFGVPGALDGCTIIYAAYVTGNYSGYALVLYTDADGTLFEAEGSHCSCYGLEDRWAPQAMTFEALAMRPDPRESYQFEDDPDAARALAKLYGKVV